MVPFAVGCMQSAKDESRGRVVRALTESLGEMADPQIAFQRDSTHLLVHLRTAAFPTVSEEALTEQARNVASLALRHFDRARELDSVTVLYREPFRKGVSWIRHRRGFSVDSLLSTHRNVEVSIPTPPNTR
jgi:hypothetical protein